MRKLYILSFLALAGIAKSQWSLTGNASTTAGTNYLGTKDAKDLVFKTNNLEAARIVSNVYQTFIVGTVKPSPQAGYKFYVTGKSAFNGSTIFTNPDNAIPAGSNLIYGYYSDVVADVNLLNLETTTSESVSPDSRFIVKSNGNVGIGTTNFSCSTCNGYRLFVRDGIRTEKIKVDVASTAGWADYVFATDYKLMPLYEVERYIDENQHLPEVPSAEEVVANGLDLKEMTTLLLKKIEELTLYTIDQQKQIDQLKKMIITEKK